MPETGGPTTESGIIYQNSIAALFLGRMCDAAQRPDRDRVYSVRVEAPVEVDDVVVTFADDHRAYIQAKESIRVGHEAWTKLWRDLDSQFRRPDFRKGRDRLCLFSGDVREDISDLKEVCLRASGAASYGEWMDGLSERHKAHVEKIKSRLSPEALDDSMLLEFFGHIDVELWTVVEMERDKVVYWMPPTDGGRRPIELFRLLRDRVGGEARRRGTLTLDGIRESLANEGYRLAIPPDIDSLRETVRKCGASLLQHKYTIAKTGRHIRRGEVDSILAWARDDDGREPVAMLLDRAGMGKSVLIRDVLVGLESVGIVTLAGKADRQLSLVDSHDAFRVTLGLPEPVERVVGRLAALGPVVVLVDQVDALSLSLARDQKALDVVLEMVARLRLIPGVRILISCRAFDRNGDPRLRSIEVKKEFFLAELPDAEVEAVVGCVGVEYGGLSSATRRLLRVPLHLDLFARALEGPWATPRDPESFRGVVSLQGLYAMVWEHVVLKPDPGGPPPHERLEVLGRITEAMFRDQRTSISRSMFAAADVARLDHAVRWLASEGILVADSNEWGFLHQTFLDYCYARRFVESGRSLDEAILESDQGLRVRPLLVQVLSYLRAGDPRKYLTELRGLFASGGMRYHLRDLLLRWFGSLAEPTDGEWSLAYRRLLDPATRTSFLAAMAGNPGWFARIDGEPLESLLLLDDQAIDAQVIPYLASLVGGDAQAEVIEIARGLADRGGVWPTRATRVIEAIRSWQSLRSVELFERLVRSQGDFLARQSHELDEIARSDPRLGCRLIRLLLEQASKGFAAKRDRVGAYVSLCGELDHLNNSTIHQALEIASGSDPCYFVEHLLPWLEEVLGLEGGPSGSEKDYRRDGLSHGWHDHIYVVRHGLIRAFVSALAAFARRDCQGFRRAARRLADNLSLTPQKLLAGVYQSEPELLAPDALDFLLSDRRRLDLGERDRYESRRLIGTIIPFLSREDRARLEGFIIDNPRPRGHLGVYGLRWRGLDQLHLLQAIPSEALTDRGRRYLEELERKFPGRRASEDPRTMHWGGAGAPIPPEAIPKMSDRNWLGAMERYRPGIANREPLKGGHRELGGALLAAVKDAPERFYRLVGTMSDEDVGPYAWAFINGVAESSAPSDWLFALIRRFALLPDSEGRQAIAWTLKKRMDSGLPNDLVELLEGWVHDLTLDRPRETEGDPFSGYLNSDRGAALGTLMRTFDHRGSVEAKDQKWRLIEFVAADASTTLRAWAIEELLFLLHEDRERAVSLFEQLMTGHPILLRSQRTQEFLYHGFYRNFAQLAPYIRALMNGPAKEHAQRGAELACIAAISPMAIESPEARDLALLLAEEAINGPSPWRQGAARVYSINLHNGPPDECVRCLSRLLDDEDEGVRYQVGGLFVNLRGSSLFTHAEFLKAFANSRCLVEGMRHFAEYLWGHWHLEPETSLSLIGAALDCDPQPGQRHRHFDGEELIRVVLRVYADPGSSEATRQASMDLFDKLMARYSGWAYQILEEWDRV